MASHEPTGPPAVPTLPTSSQLLNARELQVFLTVAELGSVGKAAAALHLTQPALSRIVKRLEQQLGVQLFERHPHGVALTAFGRRLEPHAQLMLSESARAVQELSAMRGQPQGTVRLGSVASGFSGYVPTAVERLLQRSPDLHVRLVEGVTEELLQQLARGDIDIGLAFSVPVADDIVTVSRSEWQAGNHIVAGSTHPLCGTTGLALRDLLGQRWALAPRGTQPRSEFMQLFAEHRLDPPQAVVETGSIIAMRQLIARGGFLGWMPRPLIELDQGAAADGPIRILKVQGVQSNRRFALYQRRAGVPSPAMLALRDELLALLPAQGG